MLGRVDVDAGELAVVSDGVDEVAQDATGAAAEVEHARAAQLGPRRQVPAQKAGEMPALAQPRRLRGPGPTTVPCATGARRRRSPMSRRRRVDAGQMAAAAVQTMSGLYGPHTGGRLAITASWHSSLVVGATATPESTKAAWREAAFE